MKTLFSIMLICFALNGLAQYDVEDVKNDSLEKPAVNWFELKQRIYVGGEFGLSFGGGQTYIHIAPLMGYDITEKFSAGVSAMYQLWRVNFINTTANYSTFGGGVFSRFRPWDPLLLQLEFDMFNTVDFAELTFDRVNVPAFMAGIGYARSFGGRSYYQFMLFYDFINNPNMPLPQLIGGVPIYLKLGLIWHLGD